MITTGEAGRSAPSQLLVHLYAVAALHTDRRQVRVQGLQPHAVVDDHAVSVDAEEPGVNHRAAVRGQHRCRGCRSKVETEMSLKIDRVALVHIRATVSESGFDGRVDQLLEWPLP